MVTVNWKGDMVFEAVPPSGKTFLMDTYPEEGMDTKGPTPLEAFLSAAAACSAIDIVSILQKKKQKIISYRIEIDGDRTPYGSEYPRPYTTLRIRHILTGENLDPAAVARAVDLSDSKYCSVLATLRFSPPIQSEWVIE